MTYEHNGENDGEHIFSGFVPCTISGHQGFALRILPKHDDLVEPYEPGMILWESPTGM